MSQSLDSLLVIGTGSLVGSRFIELLDQDIDVFGAGTSNDQGLAEKLKGFSELDLTNFDQTLNVVKNYPGKYVINFAGVTLVDEIEKTRPESLNDKSQLEQNLAYQVNVLGTKNLLSTCRQTNKFPIFISTGMVFDGKNGPYSEDDATASSSDEVSWYAWTKILAERLVISSKEKFLMIRISYPYRKDYAQKSDFARNLLKIYDEYKALQRKEIYPIFIDQFLTPTFIDDLEEALTILIAKNAMGVFHVGSPKVTTPYEFCCKLLKVARNVKNPEQIVPKGSIIEFQKKHPELAKRPIKGGEKVDKIIDFGFTPTTWEDGIEKAFSAI